MKEQTGDANAQAISGAVINLKLLISENIMKKQLIRYLPILLFSLVLLAINGCRVTFVPAYNTQVATQIDETAKTVDKFYLSMLETTTVEDSTRSYTFFINQYVSIEAELNSLFIKNKIRPLNQNSTRICEITLQLWQKYKEEHKKKNKLSNGLIKLNQKTFSDLFYAMQVAESGKKIIDNPPQ